MEEVGDGDAEVEAEVGVEMQSATLLKNVYGVGGVEEGDKVTGEVDSMTLLKKVNVDEVMYGGGAEDAIGVTILVEKVESEMLLEEEGEMTLSKLLYGELFAELSLENELEGDKSYTEEGENELGGMSLLIGGEKLCTGRMLGRGWERDREDSSVTTKGDICRGR